MARAHYVYIPFTDAARAREEDNIGPLRFAVAAGTKTACIVQLLAHKLAAKHTRFAWKSLRTLSVALLGGEASPNGSAMCRLSITWQ